MDEVNEWSLGRWFGIDVSLHWTVLLAFPWLYMMLHSFLQAAVGLVAVVALHIVHESGHVILARRYHLYVESVTLLGLHGRTELGTNGTLRESVLIAWGGVIAQLLLLFVSWLAIWLLPAFSGFLGWLLLPVGVVFTEWNIFLILVALLPIGPTDGGLTWRGPPMLWREWTARRRNKARAKPLSAAERVALQKKSAEVATEILRKISRVD